MMIDFKLLILFYSYYSPHEWGLGVGVRLVEQRISKSYAYNKQKKVVISLRSIEAIEYNREDEKVYVFFSSLTLIMYRKHAFLVAI